MSNQNPITGSYGLECIAPYSIIPLDMESKQSWLKVQRDCNLIYACGRVGKSVKPEPHTDDKGWSKEAVEANKNPMNISHGERKVL